MIGPSNNCNISEQYIFRFNCSKFDLEQCHTLCYAMIIRLISKLKISAIEDQSSVNCLNQHCFCYHPHPFNNIFIGAYNNAKATLANW